MGVECHQSWRFVGRHFQLYLTSPMIPNWPWAWPCWNCTTSYKFSVSVKKIGEGWSGEASDIVKAESSGEDPRANGGLVSVRLTAARPSTSISLGTQFYWDLTFPLCDFSLWIFWYLFMFFFRPLGPRIIVSCGFNVCSCGVDRAFFWFWDVTSCFF